MSYLSAIDEGNGQEGVDSTEQLEHVVDDDRL